VEQRGIAITRCPFVCTAIPQALSSHRLLVPTLAHHEVTEVTKITKTIMFFAFFVFFVPS